MIVIKPEVSVSFPLIQLGRSVPPHPPPGQPEEWAASQDAQWRWCPPLDLKRVYVTPFLEWAGRLTLGQASKGPLKVPDIDELSISVLISVISVSWPKVVNSLKPGAIIAHVPHVRLSERTGF